MGHIHGLGVDPADSVLYVASHGGVFRLTDGRLELVANRAQDTMGFTVVGPNHFLASGHPAPSDLDRPIHLGLIESTDAALTWKELSLSGKADFHSLERGVGALYGYDSQRTTVMKTVDRQTWAPLMVGNVYDLATHPTKADQFVAATNNGLVHVQGRAQSALTAPAGLSFVEWPSPDKLVAITGNGGIYQSSDEGQIWTQSGQLNGMVEAFDASSKEWFAATDQGIFTSADQGMSWTPLLR